MISTKSWRGLAALGCVPGFVLVAPRAWAGDHRATRPTYTVVTEGSTPTPRNMTDQYSGVAYIYVGAALPAETRLGNFQYLFGFAEFGNTSGYITPLLFEYTAMGEYTVFTVRGIGKGYEVKLNSAPQTLPFDIVAGTKVTPNGKYTFGFLNALLDSSGNLTKTSMGAVEFDNPADGGQGEGGPGTNNDWAAGDSTPKQLTLGTTFGVSGSGADYGLFSGYRTYSARAGGVTGK